MADNADDLPGLHLGSPMRDHRIGTISWGKRSVRQVAPQRNECRLHSGSAENGTIARSDTRLRRDNAPVEQDGSIAGTAGMEGGLPMKGPMRAILS